MLIQYKLITWCPCIHFSENQINQIRFTDGRRTFAFQGKFCIALTRKTVLCLCALVSLHLSMNETCESFLADFQSKLRKFGVSPGWEDKLPCCTGELIQQASREGEQTQGLTPLALGFNSHFSQLNLSCHSRICRIFHLNIFRSNYWICVTVNVCRDQDRFSRGLWTGMLREVFPHRCLIGTRHFFLPCPWTFPVFHALGKGQVLTPASHFHTLEVSRIVLDFLQCALKFFLFLS